MKVLKRCFSCCMLLLVVLMCGMALAQDAPVVPSPDADLGGFLGFVVAAFQAKKWGLAAASTVMLIVWGLGKLLKPENRLLPFISAGVAVLFAVVTAIVGGIVWYEAIFNGLMIGGAASGFWSLFGKHIFPKKKE